MRKLEEALVGALIVTVAVVTFPLWYFYARALDKLIVKSAPNVTPVDTTDDYTTTGEGRFF